ncbi:Crp/Fnr family transcriptional regulator [Fulvivirga kasyanovii]|uniref:Crp/Fnr family transcriptional regulator n=1 Tax=Fulvivirga kasyanovii TaxID=396812 RepID=A0ABW9RTW5_9BACT|nr:Crp/Fnr family transcriptional regulator [Fulvivirga kasyanovii]MTI27652.1 Crp/Fnr family transcriptional regulator [Fulvivirga kasyanovii]
MENTKLIAMLQNQGFENSLIDEILTVGRLKKVSKGASVIAPGSKATEIPLVIDGTIKVMRQDKDGSEIFLYYLEGGEACAMSITCCLENKKSEFSAVAEEDCILWMIPMGSLDAWIAKYPAFRKFVFTSYQKRFDEMLMAIDSMAFMKMDQRLYKYLLDKKQASGSFEIHKTHEQIARELNTSRVVISRLLKQLENEGKIEQYRNKIEIL